jgi:hypothetical protein
MTLEEDFINASHGGHTWTQPDRTNMLTPEQMQEKWKAQREAQDKKFAGMGMQPLPDKMMTREEFNAFPRTEAADPARDKLAKSRFESNSFPTPTDWGSATTGPDVFNPITDSRLPSTRQEQYLGYAKSQKGWNSDWDQYSEQIMRKLHNPDYDMIAGGVPQESAYAMENYSKGLADMYGDAWGYKDPEAPTEETQPIETPLYGKEGQYLQYARSQDGWNSDWDRYMTRLQYKLNNPDDDLTSNIIVPGYGPMAGIPASELDAISKFYSTLEPMSGEWGYDAGNATTQPGTQVGDPYNYVDPQGDYYQNQKDILNQQTTLQNLANKNAMKRQILSNAMNHRSSLGT